MKPSLVFMMRLSGSVKFFCALGSVSSDGGAAAFPGFLRPSALRRSSASARALALASARAFASASNSALAARIISARFFLSATQSGSSSPPLSPPKAFSSSASAASATLSRALGHALVAHRLVLGGVRLDLRAVKPDMTELHQSRPLAQLENLREQSGKRLQAPLAEVGDGAEIRRIESDDAHEVDPLARRLGDPARRVDAVAIAVQQQRRHHRRIKRRLSALARVSRFDGAKIEMLKHKRQNKARKVVLADKVPHAGWQQQRLIDLPGAERLAHEKAESDSRPPRHQNPLFLGQAPRQVVGSAKPSVLFRFLAIIFRTSEKALSADFSPVADSATAFRSLWNEPFVAPDIFRYALLPRTSKIVFSKDSARR